MKFTGVVAAATLTLLCVWAAPALAQNDWQYPDPYFGILEFEGSKSAGEAGASVRPFVTPRRAVDAVGSQARRDGWARRRLWRPAPAGPRPVAARPR